MSDTDHTYTFAAVMVLLMSALGIYVLAFGFDFIDFEEIKTLTETSMAVKHLMETWAYMYILLLVLAIVGLVMSGMYLAGLILRYKRKRK